MKLIDINSKAKKILGQSVSNLSKSDFLGRLQSKDATLWKRDEQNKHIIKNALGWVNVAEEMLKNLPEINSFVNFARKKFTACVVLGMGGSSLAPEVFRSVFKPKKNYPVLHILDTTNPDWILETEKKLNLKKTLFIFASKSGTTTEPHSQFIYFYNKLKKINKNPGQNFIAITDKNTALIELARKYKFTKIFVNPSDIGGRFAALSYFGLIPASVTGINIKKLLTRAIEFSKKYLKNYSRNSALILGTLLGKASIQGIDKLTLILPKNIAPFALWIEQLIAESTGKENKGIVPITGEPVISDFNYSQDRFFVNFNFKKNHKLQIENLQKYPLVNLCLNDIYDLGSQFFLWELATAAAGFVLKINPFSQPDVEQSKIFMRNILKNPSKTKIPANNADKIHITYSKTASKELKNKGRSLKNPILNFYSLIRKNHYAAILAYIHRDDETRKIFENLRKKIVLKTGTSTLFGYGPRYLHSTGQLHKGGRNNGIFLIITSSGKKDIAIKGKPYTFRQLISAQSMGDFKALESKKRRVIKIDLPSPWKYHLKNLINIL